MRKVLLVLTAVLLLCMISKSVGNGPCSVSLDSFKKGAVFFFLYLKYNASLGTQFQKCQFLISENPSYIIISTEGTELVPLETLSNSTINLSP